jgi:hypothetical protein
MRQMSITEILKTNPELAGNLEFAELCINKGKQEKPESKDPEEYLTPAQFAEALQVSLVTLWSWDKKGITRPLRIGNAKRYRRSDLEKILCNA